MKFYAALLAVLMVGIAGCRKPMQTWHITGKNGDAGLVACPTGAACVTAAHEPIKFVLLRGYDGDSYYETWQRGHHYVVASDRHKMCGILDEERSCFAIAPYVSLPIPAALKGGAMKSIF